MKHEKSCGAVVYTIEDGQLLFLAEHMRLGHISIPKGHVEGNETEEETEQISAPPRSKLKIFGYTAASVLLMLSVNFAVAFIAGDASVPDRENLLLRAAAGVLLVPAMEEYLFRRGYLKTLLKGGFPLYVPVIMQAVLFASLHRGTGVPVAFVCGTVLGVLYVKTEERYAFAAVFSAHAVYNGALYLILALS